MMKLEKKRILTALFLLAFGAAVSFAGFHAGKAGNAEQTVNTTGTDTVPGSPAAKTAAAKQTDESGRTTIDFGLLTGQNPDIYAWITVPGTVIDYPVLQKSDTEDLYDNYYLDHTADLSEGLPGAIYSQPVNRLDFSDSVTVLYGHNMKNGTMFSGLHAFADPDFFRENTQVIIYTPQQTLTYEIFAATDFSDALLPYEYDFTQDTGIQRYLGDVEESKGNFREGTRIPEGAKILTLSTCYSDREDRRLLIHAVLIGTQAAESKSTTPLQAAGY